LPVRGFRFVEVEEVVSEGAFYLSGPKFTKFDSKGTVLQAILKKRFPGMF